MTILLALLSLLGSAGLAVFAILYARASSQLANRRIALATAECTIDMQSAKIVACMEQRARLSKHVAIQAREIHELEQEFEDLSIHLPLSGADSIRARLDRLLQGTQDREGTDSDPVPGGTPAPADDDPYPGLP